MIEFSFDSLFRTTSKGLPDTSNLPPYSYITMNHFVYSVIVEIIIGLIITIYTALSVYRAFYKIKNPKFNNSNDDNSKQQNQQNDQDSGEKQDDNEEDVQQQNTNKQQGQQASQTNDNLIYRFDQQQQSEKDNKQQNNNNKKKKTKFSKRKQNKQQQQQQQQQQQDDEQKNNKDNNNEQYQQEQQQQQQVSEQTTAWYLDMDHKLLFFQPFLISFVVVVNVFATNILVLILLGLGLIFFYLFNVKTYCARKPILKIVFALPFIVVLLMVFFQDRDMST